MPHFAKSCNRTTNNRLLAVSADALEELEVVWVAIEFAFVFVAISSPKLTSTLLAAVMLRMHSLSLDGDVFANDGLLALSANTSGRVNDCSTSGLAH